MYFPSTTQDLRVGGIILDARVHLLLFTETLNYGSVAGVKNIANPVSLARLVMERTDHVMLIGQGANNFAREVGVAEVEPEKLVTEIAKKEWEEYSKFNKVVSEVFNAPKKDRCYLSPSIVEDATLYNGHDTVGAVAIDLLGNMAAATSTGGISLKRVGRVGDAPLVGSGAYCDNDVGGVSCTGHGESIAKVVLAHKALSLLQTSRESEGRGLSAVEAIEKSLEFMKKRTDGRGGVIMITSEGDIAKSFTTQRMCWASVNRNGVLESGIE